jgi:hypothetical protein
MERKKLVVGSRHKVPGYLCSTLYILFSIFYVLFSMFYLEKPTTQHPTTQHPKPYTQPLTTLLLKINIEQRQRINKCRCSGSHRGVVDGQKPES